MDEREGGEGGRRVGREMEGERGVEGRGERRVEDRLHEGLKTDRGGVRLTMG